MARPEGFEPPNCGFEVSARELFHLLGLQQLAEKQALNRFQIFGNFPHWPRTKMPQLATSTASKPMFLPMARRWEFW